MNTDNNEINKLTEKIIGCAYTVANTLGVGFMEKVYENALKLELQYCGLAVAQQFPLEVTYRNELVGAFQCDLIVEDTIILEIKSTEALNDAHLAQCINYLKATGIKACLLINFGKSKIEIRRIMN